MISPSDVARIEQWVASSYPDHDEPISVSVQARRFDVNVTETRHLPGGDRSRSIVRLRYRADSNTWTVDRLFGGGRWLDRKPVDGPLATVLAEIDLRQLPRP